MPDSLDSPSLNIYSPPPLPQGDERFSDRLSETELDRENSHVSEAFMTARCSRRSDSLELDDASQARSVPEPVYDGGGNAHSIIDSLRSYYGSGEEELRSHNPTWYVRRLPSQMTQSSLMLSEKASSVGKNEIEDSLLVLEEDYDLKNEEVWDTLPRWKKFVVQFNVSHFSVAIGLSAHAVLWRTLSRNFAWLRLPQEVWFVLWFAAVMMFSTEVVTYVIRSFAFPQGLQNDFSDNRLLNFFMAPVIVLTNVLSSVPPFLETTPVVSEVLGYCLVGYQLLFALYIYGDWLFSREFSLHKIDPTYQMAVIGFFLVSRVASDHGDISAAEFNLFVGILFWFVVFAALFMNVASALRSKSADPSPTMFLFLAPPAAAALAISSLDVARGATGSFSDLGVFFVMVDGFLFLLLLRLLPVWVFQRFNIAWWAYVFPLSTASSALVGYAVSSGLLFWKIAAVASSVVAMIALAIVVVFTVLEMLHGELPNDAKAKALYCERLRNSTRKDSDSNV